MASFTGICPAYVSFPIKLANQSNTYLKNNVLVDALGRASLADPGLSVLVPEILGMSYFRLSTSGAIRYAPPELFRASTKGQVSLPSTFSDIYSLGSIILLVSPFYHANTRLADKLYIIGTFWSSAVFLFDEGQRCARRIASRSCASITV